VRRLLGGGIVGSALVASAGLGVGMVAALGVRLVVARGFDPEIAGLLFLAIAVATPLGSLASLGTGPPLARGLARLPGDQQGWFARRALVVPVVAGSLAGLMLAALSGPLAATLDSDGQLADTLRALALTVPALAVGTALVAVARGRGRVLARSLLRDGGGGVLRLLAVVVVVAQGGGIVAVALAFALGSVLAEVSFLAAALVGGWLAGSPVEPGSPGEIRPSGITWGERARFVSLDLLAQSALWLDVVVLAAVATPAEVGLYALARSLVRSLEGVRSASAHAVLPRAAADWRAHGAEAAAASVERGRTVLRVLLAAPVLVMVLAPDVVVGWLGGSWGDAARVLAVLAVGGGIMVASAYRDVALVAADRESLVVRTDLVVVPLGLLVVLVMGWRFGAVGAAVAVGLRELSRSTLLGLAATRSGVVATATPGPLALAGLGGVLAILGLVGPQLLDGPLRLGLALLAGAGISWHGARSLRRVA
jgi:O-antigen/teichoic acid export membrane protein